LLVEPEPITDAPLLLAIERGDLGALGTLYDRHASSVWRVVRRVTNGASDVDDIVHATFLKVPRLAASFDGRASARGWLVGIAVRLALRHTRTLRRFTGMLKRFAHVTHDVNQLDPEVLAIGRAQLAVLERATSKLSPTKRAVFVLVEIEGFAPDEVARDLGVPAATVRTRLFHAKRELRKALALAESR
jgi:RNA polymerase sigma-70 factor (ECF subfamily)